MKMSSRIASSRAYILLFVVTLVFRIAAALPLERAGDLNASYLFHLTKQLAAGCGHTENVLWNYLDAPHGLFNSNIGVIHLCVHT